MKKFFAPVMLAAGVAFVAAPLAGFADAGVLAKKGDIVGGKLTTTLSSKTNHSGDTFTMTEQDTFFHKNAALHGAVIEGHVDHVAPPSPPLHAATMNIFFDDIKLADGTKVPLAAKVQNIKPPTHHIRDAMLIAGGFVAGKVVASKTGHGGMAGAAGGFALAESLKSNITLGAGTVVKLQLTQDLVGQ